MDEKRTENPNQQKSLPPTIAMAKNLALAMVKHAADGLKKVTPKEFTKRLSVCNTCEHRLKNRCTHPKCGCFLEIKAWWKSEDCPIEKWPKLED